MNSKRIIKAKYIPIGFHQKTIMFYFYVGIFSAILLRATILLNFFSTNLAKLAWYIGVFGYMLFFMHRNRVSERRSAVIKELGLLKKIERKAKLDAFDYEGLHYVLWSISVSKEKLNFLYIQIFSAIALLIALVLDVYHIH